MNSTPQKSQSQKRKRKRTKGISVTRIGNKRLITSGRIGPEGILIDKENIDRVIELLRKKQELQELIDDGFITPGFLAKLWPEPGNHDLERDEKVEAAKRPPQSTRASANGEFLLSILLNKDEQEAAIGDFLERYAHKLQRLGKLRADLWAYSDVARTVWPVLQRKLAKTVGIVGAADWIRRHLW